MLTYARLKITHISTRMTLFSFRKPAESHLTSIKCMESAGLEILKGHTGLMVAPGYQIQTADMLVTNFHQPESTLLLLVSAFIGEDWRDVYKHALANDYRFLSYGDSSLLHRK